MKEYAQIYDEGLNSTALRFGEAQEKEKELLFEYLALKMSLASAETSSVEESSNEPSTSNSSDVLSVENSTPIKRRDFSVSEKVELLIKYDALPKMSQSKAAKELNISKQLVCRLLQQRADIMQAWLHNKDTHRKRRRCGKDGEVETALKEWFDRACAEGATVTGPIMRKKAEELAKKLGKKDFVATDGWFSRWRKRENIMLLGRPRSEQNVSEIPAGQWPELLAAYSAECVYGAEGTASRDLESNATPSTSCPGTDLNSTADTPLTPVRAIVQQCPAKRNVLSISDKLEVLAKYDALPPMSQSLAASQLGVSQPLLCKLLKTRQEIEQESLQNASRKRKRSGKDSEVETALKEWFHNAQKEGVNLTGPIMRKKAEELARELGKEDFVATDGWFSRWRRRENITTGKPRAPSESSLSQGTNSEEGLVPEEHDIYKMGTINANEPMIGMADTNTPYDETISLRSVYSSEYVHVGNTELDVKPVITSTTSDECVPQWYLNPENESTSMLSTYPTHSIYSIEISSVNYLSKHSCVEETDYDLPQERLSILCCVNMCGFKQKLLVVGQRDNRPCFRNVHRLPVDYYFNDEARVTPHIIFDWLIKWDRNLKHEIVLMMDDCQDLRSITSFQNLKFMPVPESLGSCGTSLSQSLHRQFTELKRQRLQRLRLVDCDESIQSAVPGSTAQSTDFLGLLHLIAHSWENIPKSTILGRFIKCGLLTGIDNTSPNQCLSSEANNAPSHIKIEACETVSDLVVDQHDAAPPTNEDLQKALSVLSRAVYHRADEFSLHYQYEKFIHSLL